MDRPAPGLCVAQPARGFRYGAEAFWLAGFALEGLEHRDIAGLRGLDLGTGSGIVAGLLARAGLRALGVDLRSEWQPLWERTLQASEVGERLRLELADVAHATWHGMDLVTSNPPFFPAGSGPEAADPWRAAARTESTATLDRFVQVGLGALGEGGRLCLVVPVERAAAVRTAARAAGGGVTRSVKVGRRRWLAQVEPGDHAVQDDVIGEDDPRARRWYALARGGDDIL